jgi:hypothetical protein
MVTPELVALGRDATERVALGIRTGATLTHCQLIASPFYDALRGEGETAPRLREARRWCEWAADAKATPDVMLARLKTALAVLAGAEPHVHHANGRPMLRVIQGGLA